MSETWQVDLSKAVSELTGDTHAIVHAEPERLIGHQKAMKVTAVWKQDGKARYFQQVFGFDIDEHLNSADQSFFMDGVRKVFKGPPLPPRPPV